MAEPLTLATDPRLTETVEYPQMRTVWETPPGVPAPMIVPDREQPPVMVTRQVRVHLGMGYSGESISLAVCRWCHGPLFDRADHLAEHTAWHQANNLHGAECTGPLRHPDMAGRPCPCGLYG